MKVFKTKKYFVMFLLLLFSIQSHGSVFATINPNNYSVDFSIQNQNQGISVPGTTDTERYEMIQRGLSVSTNAPSGYRIYASIPSSEASQGDLILVDGDSSDPKISLTGSTPATANTLNANNWGFGIPNTVTGLPANNFSSTYNPSAPSSSNTYSGIEVNPGYTLIRNVQSAISGTDSFNLYYGIRLGQDVLSTPGTYETHVSYHALIEATDVVGGEATITPSSGPKTGGETVTITTSLMTDFIPDGINVTIGGLTCDNPKGNISTGTLIITCNTKAHTPEQTDVEVSIDSLGINYTIEDGYEYLETGDVKITAISYVSGTNVNGTPHPTVTGDNSVDFDLTFKSGTTQDDNTFTARYRMTITNTTSNGYIFTAPVSNLVLRLSSTTTSEVYYELSGISVGDTIPANDSVTFDVILSADYASGTHAVEGDIEVNPVEDKTGSLTGNINGSNEGDLSGDNELAMFQINVQNTFSSDKVFTIELLGSDFQVTNASGQFLEAQTIAANSSSTYTFYVKKANGATYGSDYVNRTVVIDYDGAQSSVGTLKLDVDKDPSYVDTEAPIISDVAIVRNDTIGSATVTWSGTDNVGVASYSIYPCTKTNDSYTCGSPITGISGNDTSYNLTGLSDGTYGVVVVGYDDEGNSATQQEIDSATTNPGHASRSADTEIKWTFTVTGQITNGTLSNNGSTVQMGGSYTGTIRANSGYNLPGSITVQMNGRDLTTSQYTYSNGVITIQIPVDGDIVVTANCPWNWCLIEGTMIALADGTSVPIEDITYDSLLKVWNYETGSVGAEYPAWIEKKAVTTSYQLTKFDDGTELKTSGWHGVFDVDRNAFISIDDPDFKVGSRVYKVNENDQLEVVTVTSIERVEEEVHYYHVVSSQYYNIIANGIITTDGAVYLSNLYGFDENIKWPSIREEVMSDPNNLYSYEDFEDIGMPRKMFDDLRVREAKYLATKYGITLEAFKGYLLSNQLNTDIWLHYCDGSVRLKEEFCPVAPETNNQTPNNTNNTNSASRNTTSTSNSTPSSSEEVDQDYETSEIDKDVEPQTKVLGSTDGNLSSKNPVVDAIIAGSIVTSTALAAAILLSKEKEGEE